MRRALTLLSVWVLLLVAALALANPVGAQPIATQLPPGTYATTITAADLPAGFPPFLAGQWEIELTEDGSYVITKDGEFWAEGRYISNPAVIVATDEEGPGACLGNPSLATGVYEWTLNNNEATFTLVHDACGGRAFVVTAHPWQKIA